MLVPYKAIVYYTYPFGRVVFCQSLTYGGSDCIGTMQVRGSGWE
ncbi:MAG: hypothetical protein ACLU7M_00955 [Mediterraneibacter gnavus]